MVKNFGKLVVLLFFIFLFCSPVYRSTCSTWGREHFKTFDGDVYRFPGMCEYKLVSANTNSQDSQTFSVDLKRKENHENSTISFVVVKINSYLYNISKDLVTLNEQR